MILMGLIWLSKKLKFCQQSTLVTIVLFFLKFFICSLKSKLGSDCFSFVKNKMYTIKNRFAEKNMVVKERMLFKILATKNYNVGQKKYVFLF